MENGTTTHSTSASMPTFNQRIAFFLLFFLIPFFGFAQKGNDANKITVCHKGKTISVSENALQAHLNHGDAVGACLNGEEFEGSVIPIIESGKVEEEIGPELTALEESFEENGSAASDEIFVVSENKLVLIEIVAQRGKEMDLEAYLRDSIGITEFVEDGSDIVFTVLFPIDQLSRLNEKDDIVRFATPVYQGITNSGAVTSQGDIAQQSDNARAAFKVDGQGVRIAVLSDSYNSKGFAQSDVNNGDLPGTGNLEGNLTPVTLIKEYPVGEIGSRFSVVDEGRSMLQIIHDVAPKAELGFRTGLISPGDMAVGILELQTAGYDIIVDDISWIEQPFFVDGPIAKAVDQVTSLGVQYFTSAGNFGSKSYEGVLPGSSEQTVQNVTLGPGLFQIVLQWDDDYYEYEPQTDGALNDLDIIVVDGSGNVTQTSSDNLGNNPIEVLTFYVDDTTAATITVRRAAGTETVNFKYIVFQGNYFEIGGYAGSSTIAGHANAAGAITVGAVRYDLTPAYDSVARIQTFSSWGGLEIDGQNRNKPDFIAPNGGNTSVDLGSPNYDDDQYPNFFGTSASAPHAAGVAALLLHAQTKFGASFDTRQLLKQTALDVDVDGFDEKSGSGLILADEALSNFAAPVPTISELVKPEGATPGLAPFDLTINGKNLRESTRILLDGEEISAGDTEVVSSSEVIVTIPQFEGDPPIQAITNAISATGVDGGISEPLYLIRAPKRKILVTADNKSKKYGEVLPVFTSTITVDGIPLDSTSLTLDSLGLDVLTYKSSANSLTPVGNHVIVPIDSTESFDSELLEFYDYTFENGTLTIEKTLLTITPNDLTTVYGEAISGITYNFEYDDSNIDSADNLVLIDNIQLSYSSTFVEDSIIAVLDRGRGIVNRGRGIVNGTSWSITYNTILNRGRGIVNRGRGIVNQGRGIVNSLFIDMPDILLDDYVDDPANSLTNRGRGIVNGTSFFAGEASLNRGRGIVNDEGVLVDRGRGIVNDGALVNNDAAYEGFNDLIVVVDSTDYAISSLFSINLISGIDVTTDSLHYIVPGGYFADESENFEITYGLGNLTILPDTLTVTVQDEVIALGDTIPTFAAEITGYSYEEVDSTVFSSITFTPTTYDQAGSYPIVPTLVFADQENYVFAPDPIVPGRLTVLDVNGRIAVAHVGESSSLETEFLNSDGGVPVPLPVVPESIRDPQFSPDGNDLAFTLAPINSASTATSLWNATGPGALAVEDGTIADNGQTSFLYTLNPAGFAEQTWTFSTIATGDEPFSMDYNWSGFHAFFAVTTTLQVTDEGGTRVIDNIQPGGVGGPDNCCGGVSAGFNFSGTVTVDPVAGQPIIFTLKGRNGDSNNQLNGTFTLSPAAPTLADLTPQDQSVWKVNVDGSGLTELSAGLTSHSPSYSSDGAKIAYIKDNEVAIMNADGTGQVTLTSSSSSKRWTAFSPDEQEIIYVQSGADIYADTYSSIWKVNVSTLATEQISQDDSTLFLRSPVFLRDGSRIIYVRQDLVSNTPWAIMSINPDGSGGEALYSNDYLTNDVDVSPDNSKLVFSLQDSISTDYTLHTMDITGENVEEIYRESNLILWPSWGTTDDFPESINVFISDPNFEQALIDLGIDSDGIINQQILRSDAEAVTALNVSDPLNNPNLPGVSGKISNLRGIEAFVNLQTLEFQYNSVADVDLTQNTLLTHLYGWENQLQSLDLSQNSALLELNVDLNQLTSLDLSNNTALESVSGSDNNLTSIDVSQSAALSALFVVGNQLTALNVSQNPALQILNCDINYLTNLDLSQNPNLSEVFCANNLLTRLDARNGNNANLLIFDAYSNNLSCINVDDESADHSVWNIDVGVILANDCEATVAIPDANFEQALIDLGIDSDSVVNQQMLVIDARTTTYLDVSDPENNVNLPNVSAKISDLTGIEAFTNLETLKCQQNLLANLDLAQNELLADLDASYNQLTAVNISNNPLLYIVLLRENLLTNLSLNTNTALINLDLVNNRLNSIDLSANQSLVGLGLSENQLDTLDVSQNTALAYLDCYGNQLTELNLTLNPALEELQCGGNQLAELDLSGNPLLTGLFCDFNQLNGLVLTQNTQLVNMSCVYNAIDTLDISNNTLLKSINVGGNQLRVLDVSQNTLFEVLNAGENQLTALDVSMNPALQVLAVGANQLASLDVSQNSALTELYADNNLLASLDVRNGTNANITQFDARNNGLSCINVDEENAGYHIIWNVDAGVAFKTNCNATVSIPDQNFEQALIDLGIDSDSVINQQIFESDAVGVTSLNIYDPENNILLPNVNGKIANLTGIEAFTSLQSLDVHLNLLTALDLAQNVNLASLNFQNNQVSNIDLSQNTSISYLYCGGNQLDSLDVSMLPDLNTLYSWGNLLTSLDLSQNILLTRLISHTNQLTSLDFSQNVVLDYLHVSNNSLTTLNVRNGNNTNVTVFNASGNNLDCISVDDENAAYLSGWNVDPGVSFSNDCQNPGTSTTADVWIFHSNLIAYNNFYDLVLEQSGYSGNSTIRGPRFISASETGDYAWVAELGNHELSKVSADGDELATADLSKKFGAVDISSDERVYATGYTGNINLAGGVYILDNQGNYLDSAASYGGWDMVLSERDSAVWLVDGVVTKLDTDLNLIFTLDLFAWTALSVDVDVLGNAWIGEGGIGSLPASSNQLVHLSSDGLVIDAVPTLSGRPNTVRVNKVDGKVWYTNGTSLIYYDPIDSTHVNVGSGEASLDIDYFNSVIWTYASGQLLKYRFDGSLIKSINNANLNGELYVAARSFFGDYGQVATDPGAAITQGNITIYPNPVVNYLQVAHANQSIPVGDLTIRIFNATGLEQFTFSSSPTTVVIEGVTSNGLEVDMTQLDVGTYYLHVDDMTDLEIIRIIKE